MQAKCGLIHVMFIVLKTTTNARASLFMSVTTKIDHYQNNPNYNIPAMMRMNLRII